LKTEQECSKMFLQIMTPVCWTNIAGSDTVFILGERLLMYTVTPQLMTIPFMTNWSYDHSSIKKISAFLPVCESTIFFLQCI